MSHDQWLSLSVLSLIVACSVSLSSLISLRRRVDDLAYQLRREVLRREADRDRAHEHYRTGR